MAYMITDECTACGVCPQVCPNNAIWEAAPIFHINTWLCTECLGFAGAPQCVEVCSANAVVLAAVAVLDHRRRPFSGVKV
ncbi:MAG: 4Fe-4S dicluster domain-containing protein [Acidobacteria bacterium]|nr:4Fe-4S dicluster domain-containing protein [Acidobacteriota bacterium]